MENSVSSQILNIGFSNVVFTDKILAVVSPESAPIRRMIQEAKDGFRVIDATYGRKTRSVIILVTNHIILSSVQVETISSRIKSKIESEI